jgi:hypothetical protein
VRFGRLRRERKRLPPAPFINVDDRAPGERIREWTIGAVIAVVALVLPVAALAVALILQATWLPIAGAVAALVILLVFVLPLLGAWPFGPFWD